MTKLDKVRMAFLAGGERTKRDMRYLTLGSIASSSALYSKALATVVIGGVKFGFFVSPGQRDGKLQSYAVHTIT